jgi:predicted Zn-ribbon and HTH transcriptional regulator
MIPPDLRRRNQRRQSSADTSSIYTDAVTRRKGLLDLLTREPRSVSRLARELGLSRGEVEDDLRHMIRSARAAGYDVVVLPARCRSCDFTFHDDRLGKPGRCPVCKGSRILAPQIYLER